MKKPEPRIIEVSGIARRAPPASGRPETGALKFGDDWPGLFIRGDTAMAYKGAIEQVLEVLEKGGVPPMHQISLLRALRDDLRLPLDSEGPVQALLDWAACKPES